MIEQTIVEEAAGSGDTLYVRRTILLMEIVTDTTYSAAHDFRTPADVSQHVTDRSTPWEGNTPKSSTRLTSSVWIVSSNTGSPTRTGSQDIISPRGSIGPQEVRDSQPLDTSIDGIYSNHRDPAPRWSKFICQKFTNKLSADVNSCCWMNLTHDAVLTKSPNFVNLGLSSVHTFDEIGSVCIPTSRIGTPEDGFNWILPGHCIGEVTSDRVRRKGSDQNYNAKTDFETRK